MPDKPKYRARYVIRHTADWHALLRAGWFEWQYVNVLTYLADRTVQEPGALMLKRLK